jgi:hypothetical protein
VKIDRGRGAPTYVARRRDNGVTIHQGGSRIMLAPDELAEVLEAIHTLTSQGSRVAAEKAIEIDERH